MPVLLFLPSKFHWSLGTQFNQFNRGNSPIFSLQASSYCGDVSTTTIDKHYKASLFFFWRTGCQAFIKTSLKHTMDDFKLPTWLHWMWSWEAKHTSISLLAFTPLRYEAWITPKGSITTTTTKCSRIIRKWYILRTYCPYF